MLIDSVRIIVSSGNGGKGAVAFSKIMMTLGPTGGSGGKGGDVYFEAVSDIGALRRFRARKSFAAENGRDGRSAFRDGHVGADLVLLIPRGTVIHTVGTGERHELVRIGERLCVAKGGKGGKGNFLYKSSVHTSPKKFQSGLPGETLILELELKLIADVGLIGFPNVGKSSFLNAVTNAQSRVANYPFTTLEPHLGAYETLILADIPGLIAGASTGKGLGIKFLRHIERTRVLFHFIDAGAPDPRGAYDTIRSELGAYNAALLTKPEYIFIAKVDTVSGARVKEVAAALAATGREIAILSIHDAALMQAARLILNRIAREGNAAQNPAA